MGKSLIKMRKIISPGEHHDESNEVQIIHRLGINIAAHLTDKIQTNYTQRHLLPTQSSFQEVNRDLHNRMPLKSLEKTIFLC